MGMPIVLEIVDSSAIKNNFEKVFDYFSYVDEKFSTYKDTSEIIAINRGEIKEENWSDDMKEIFLLSEKMKKNTNGYFDIKRPDGSYDPSGVVKGWSIKNAAKILKEEGFKNFYIEAGGDIETYGKNSESEPWSIGIRNPFKRNEIVKVVYLENFSIATSGTYERGQHIYNPHKPGPITEISSISVIGSDICMADVYATAAFAMGLDGIYFIEKLPGFEGYMIDKNGKATETSGFEAFTKKQ
jgi:thiamine biosynthesis lipoprotein